MSSLLRGDLMEVATYFRHLRTPFDAPAVNDLFQYCWNHGQYTTRFSSYEATSPVFYHGITDQLARGVDVAGLFDQSEGEQSERSKLRDLWSAVPLANQRFSVGTSPIRHAILHRKTCVFNAPNGRPIEEKCYTTVEDAFADGYPVVWDGSWNFTPEASDQSNSVYIIPSSQLAAEICTDIDTIRAYINRFPLYTP